MPRSRERKKEVVVFTNGCFDLLHPGHLDLLRKARALGTRLVVGINSDRSVRAIKGSPRPFMDQEARADLLGELRAVDEVRIFDENTPERLIREVRPDVLVKGGDWGPDQIVGADFVLKNGGKVFSIPFEKDLSSSQIVAKIGSQIGAVNAVDSQSKMPDAEVTGEGLRSLLDERLRVLAESLGPSFSALENCASIISEALSAGRRVVFSSEGENHLLAEFLSAALVANLGLSEEKSRQILYLPPATLLGRQAVWERGDLLLAFSLGGTDPEILSAVMQARQAGCRTVGVCGAGGKKLASLCDQSILIRSHHPRQVREIQFMAVNILGEFVEEKTTARVER